MSKISRFIAHTLQHALPCSVTCTVATVLLVLFLADPLLTDRETLALILMSCGLTGLIWTAARVGQRHLAQAQAQESPQAHTLNESREEVQDGAPLPTAAG